MILIHPPLSKPCEPPAGLARLAGTANGKRISVVDANIDVALRVIRALISPMDTWTRRAIKNIGSIYQS